MLFCSLLVPVDQLTCESALYWQAICKYFHGMGNDGDEFMEKVLPTCVDYCSYVQRYVYCSLCADGIIASVRGIVDNLVEILCFGTESSE